MCIRDRKYTEGRFLPYFFPDTFHEGGDPVREAKENWVTARRAIPVSYTHLHGLLNPIVLLSKTQCTI